MPTQFGKGGTVPEFLALSLLPLIFWSTLDKDEAGIVGTAKDKSLKIPKRRNCQGFLSNWSFPPKDCFRAMVLNLGYALKLPGSFKKY